MYSDFLRVLQPGHVDPDLPREVAIIKVRLQVQAVPSRFHCLLQAAFHGQPVGIVDVDAAGFDNVVGLEVLEIKDFEIRNVVKRF